MWVKQEKGNGAASGIKPGIRVCLWEEQSTVVVKVKGHKVDTCDVRCAREGAKNHGGSEMKL